MTYDAYCATTSNTFGTDPDSTIDAVDLSDFATKPETLLIFLGELQSPMTPSYLVLNNDNTTITPGPLGPRQTTDGVHKIQMDVIQSYSDVIQLCEERCLRSADARASIDNKIRINDN